MTNIDIANTKEQYILIERLGKIVWREHYTSIIGKNQVEYMLNKFQTAKAIETQVSEGYRYYIISNDDNPAGYFSIKKNDDDLFLSKFYVLKNFRGQGLGKTAMNFIENQATNINCNKIMLTVNRHNKNAISIYEKTGFINTGTLVKDIGNGFVMDDFTMKKNL